MLKSQPNLLINSNIRKYALVPDESGNTASGAVGPLLGGLTFC